jgi:hypothetical protein
MEENLIIQREVCYRVYLNVGRQLSKVDVLACCGVRAAGWPQFLHDSWE